MKKKIFATLVCVILFIVSVKSIIATEDPIKSSNQVSTGTSKSTIHKIIYEDNFLKLNLVSKLEMLRTYLGYKANLQNLDEALLNKNMVPYISTYFIKPTILPGEEAKLDFYVTDYNQIEYKNDDKSQVFVVTVKVQGKPDIVKEVKAGDNSISLGSFENEGEVRFSIYCTDSFGRNSTELFNFVRVKKPTTYKEYVMKVEDLSAYGIKNSDTYENVVWVDVPTGADMGSKMTEAFSSYDVPDNTYTSLRVAPNGEKNYNTYWNHNKVKYANNYDKNFVLKESTSTRNGLQTLVDKKALEGYNKVKLLEGTYRLDHIMPIYVPSNMTLDLNQATLKLNPFAGNKSLMLTLNNTYDSHVINGTIEGDYYSHDYSNSPNDSEWVNGIEISSGSKFSSFENVVVKNITGYGGGNGIEVDREKKLWYTYQTPKSLGSFAEGEINRKTGLFESSPKRTVNDFVDISDYKIPENYIQVGIYLGYQGNPCITWNIINSFYDKDKKYLKSIDGYFYRKMEIPEGATYVRTTILNKIFPKDLELFNFRVPTHCAFKEVKFENCRAVGLAQAAMKDMLVENCEFTMSGQTLARCAYDAEDGWDMMQDTTLRGLKFYNNPNNQLLTTAGHNFVLEYMKDANVYLWERTNSTVIRNNTMKSNLEIRVGSRRSTGYCRIYENNITGNISLTDAGAKKNEWQVVVKNSRIKGYARNEIDTGKYVNCEIGSLELKPNMESGNFIDCYINNISGDIYAGEFENCNFENVSGILHGLLYIKDSKLNNSSFRVLDSYVPEIKIINSKLKNTTIDFDYWTQRVSLTIQNCIISNDDYLIKLPHYSLKKPITIQNNTISSAGKNGIIWFYDDRVSDSNIQSPLTLESNKIDIPNSSYIITGLVKNGNNTVTIISKNNIFDEKTTQLYPLEFLLK